MKIYWTIQLRALYSELPVEEAEYCFTLLHAADEQQAANTAMQIAAECGINTEDFNIIMGEGRGYLSCVIFR
jgi:hypothetical protein